MMKVLFLSVIVCCTLSAHAFPTWNSFASSHANQMPQYHMHQYQVPQYQMHSALPPFLTQNGMNPSSRAGPRYMQGLMVVCERGPAEFFLSTSWSVKYNFAISADCKQQRVLGKPGSEGVNGKVTKWDHANLWPFHGEEFNELENYKEYMVECQTGHVSITREDKAGTTTVLKCPASFDAQITWFRYHY